MSPSHPVPFSVLDLAPVVEGGTPGQALHDSIELARTAEELGYHRMWVAEHHNMPGIASSAPSVLIAHLAGATTTLRLGSGGVMLPNHPPLVVAEQFGMLEALHPGRIDLGIGRAPGTDPNTARALRRSTDPLSAEDFPQQFGELLGFFDGAFPEDHPYRSISAVPGRGDRPSVWLLGSSGFSAQLAGMLGLPFSFAHHFAAANTLPALKLYRDSFRPSAVLDRPYAMVAASVTCADTDEEAERLAKPGWLSFLRLRTGHPGPLPTVEAAEAYPYTDLDRAMIADRAASAIVGSPETVRAGLADLLSRTDADELMITNQIPGQKARLHSFSLVADLRATLAE